jgi:hypothetical protein
MEALRSRRMITESGAPPVSPNSPPARGRVTTKIIAATASTRAVRMRICLKRDSPLFIFCAASRNIIAAHFTTRRRCMWIK